MHGKPTEDGLVGDRVDLPTDEPTVLFGLKLRCSGGVWFVSAVGDQRAYLNEEPLIGMQPLVDGTRLRVGWHVLEFLVSEDIAARYHEVIYGLLIRNGLSGLASPRLLRDVLAQQGGSVLSIEHPCTTPDDVIAFAARLKAALGPDELAAQLSPNRYEVLVQGDGQTRLQELAEQIGVTIFHAVA